MIQTAAHPISPQRKAPSYLPGIALFLITLLTYIPSMTNGFIWDDPSYVVDNPTLKSEGAWGNAENLWRIWTDVQATPQYYPMVHSSFWVEARLWGTHTAAGYHVDNILLHALAAVLLWRALLSIGVPWPWLVAAIFAVHPVMVESVTWVTERKNVLSIVFYLLAFRAYRRSGLLTDAGAPGVHPGLYSNSWYLRSLGLFVLALLSKTVTCSLPAAILLVIYWKRGRISWANVKPLLPMFAIGLVLAGITSHLEATRVGASGPDFQWSPIDRMLIAGHAICFYAGKLIWPHPLMFMYPHWNLHVDQARQLMYPLIAVTVVALLWATGKWLGRGPLVAVLFFIGTLTPALGFVNVYPMRYSFVADHFQYLASIGIIALFTAALHSLAKRGASAAGPRLELIASLLILSPLIVLTWRQQHIYKDAYTLWQNTIEQNHNCWMAHVNLARYFENKGEQTQAIEQSEKAQQLAPEEADTNYDLGIARFNQQRWIEARRCFEAAIRCDPTWPPPWCDLARLLWEHFDKPEDQAEAVAAAHKALSVRPGANLPDAHYVLGRAAESYGDFTTACDEYRKTLALNEKDVYAHFHAGFCLLQLHRYRESINELKKVLDLRPNDTGAMVYLADAKAAINEPAEAMAYYQKALSIDPKLPAARDGIARLTDRGTRNP
jgi:tetratricopeptide (TPR) repeat protein